MKLDAATLRQNCAATLEAAPRAAIAPEMFSPPAARMVDQREQADLPAAPVFDLEAERERIRQELLAEMQAKAEPAPIAPRTGIVATFGKIALVRGEYKGEGTLGLYPLDDKGIKRARDGEQYPIKGHCHCLSWWREHDAAIRALLDATKEA